MEEIRAHFVILSQDGSKEGFGEDLGRFLMNSKWDLGKISIEISKVFSLKLFFSRERSNQQDGLELERM